MEAKRVKVPEWKDPYREWHCNLKYGCFCLDIDSVECRNGRGIVAFIGYTGRCKDEAHIQNCHTAIFTRAKPEHKVLRTLAKQMNIPAYFVVHTDDMTLFYVYKLDPEDSEKYEFKRMTEPEYRSFIENL